MRAVHAASLAISLVAGGLAGRASAQPVDDRDGAVRSFDLRLSNIERATERLGRDFAEPQAIIREYPLETRLIEARVLFDQGEHEAVSVMLLELVELPAFQAKPEYPDALLMLARSLITVGNTRAARKYLIEVRKLPSPTAADEALYHLVDIAHDAGDDDELRRVLAQPGGAAPSVRTSYALGKAHLRLGDYQRAIQALSVATTDPALSSRARYYIAVAMTATKQFGPATAAFRDLAQAAGQGVDGQVRNLSLLALGRLKLEEGDLVGAVNEYQRVDRHDPSYEVALYEMAWAYIKAEQYDRALSTIDALLLTVKDPALDVEAHSLRGRLNIFLNDYPTAVESFEKIVARFAPIRNELERFGKDPENVHRYFHWLLTRNLETMELDAPLTPRTAAWVESAGEMQRVAQVFDDLSNQRKELEETLKIAEDLERIVSSKNAVELFPELRDGWARALVMENQLILLSSEILDFQHKTLARSGVLASDEEELTAMVGLRRQLEARFRSLPMTVGQYDARQAAVDDRFLDLKRQNFLVGQRLKEVRRQLLAVERYVNERQFGDNTKKWSSDEEEELRTSIEDEKAALKDMYDELAALDTAVEVESRRVGTGDAATRGEADLKAAIIAAHKREGLFYEERGGGEVSAAFRKFGEQRDRIFEAVRRLSVVIGAIDAKVGEKSKELAAQIRNEARFLGSYAGEMGSYEKDGRRIGLDVGEALFRRAREKMKEVVLGAEVGLIDVAWQEKLEVTDEIRKVNRERSEKTSRLDATLRDLTTERIEVEDEEAEPAPPQKPAGETTEESGEKKTEEGGAAEEGGEEEEGGGGAGGGETEETE